MNATELDSTAGYPTFGGGLRVAIVVGSTRPGRRAAEVAEWVLGLAQPREDATFEVVDIADYDLPLLDEPLPPMAAQYSRPHTLAWAAAIASFDAFVFVTPEYNHSTSGALKNAVDFLFAEWNDKSGSLVTYGADGGIRAGEHLRLVLGELKVATVRSTVPLFFGQDFEGYGPFTPQEIRREGVEVMLDELVAWGRALRSIRQPAAAA